MATESPEAARGVVVVNADTGRALRRSPAAISVAEVLDCSGEFRVGERVYVTARGRDGGQSAIALGLAGIDAVALRELLQSAMDATRELPRAIDAVVLDGLRVLWRVAS